MKFKLAPLFLFFVAGSSFAATVDVLYGDIRALKNQHRPSDYINGYVGGMSNQFNQNIGNVPGNRYNGSLYFDYHNPQHSYSGDMESRFTLSSMVNDQNLTLFSVQEAYVAKEFNQFNKVTLGRQILPWAPLDSTWGFGKLNNRRNFDFFEPGQEGLIGLNYTAKAPTGMRVSLFASGLFIPEMNPGMDVDKKSGTITSRSQWAPPPNASGEVETGKFDRIHYDVRTPDAEDVIYRYTMGFNIGYESKHLVVDNFFIRKPENQISVVANAKHHPSEQMIKATITPQVYYHDVWGSSLRYRNAAAEYYVSAMAIRPNTFPDGDRKASHWTDIKTEKRREDYAGFGYSKSNDLYTYGFNYVARLSPYDRRADQLAQDPRWNQAINVFALRNIGRHYSVLGDLKYDMLTTDRLAMIRVIYNATRSFQLHAGVNWIGTPEDGRSFWSPYTNNDAVYGGLRLLF